MIRHLIGLSILAAGLPLASPAHAANPVITENIDEPGRTPYEESAQRYCTVAGPCNLQFSFVPAGKRRVIQHISCGIYAPGATVNPAILTGNQGADYLPPVQTPDGSWVVNTNTLLFFEAGDFPQALEYSRGAPIVNYYCTITGHDITLP